MRHQYLIVVLLSVIGVCVDLHRIRNTKNARSLRDRNCGLQIDSIWKYVKSEFAEQKATNEMLEQQSQELKKRNEQLARLTDDLKRKGEEWERQTQELAREVDLLKAQNALMARRTNFLKKYDHGFEKKIHLWKKMKEALEQKILILMEQIQNLTTGQENLREMVQENKEDIKKEKNVTAFYASTKFNASLPVAGEVVGDYYEFLLLGDIFDPVSGEFTAPGNCTFEFHFTVFNALPFGVADERLPIQACLQIDGDKLIQSCITTRPIALGSGTRVFFLDVIEGQKVEVVMDDSFAVPPPLGPQGQVTFSGEQITCHPEVTATSTFARQSAI